MNHRRGSSSPKIPVEMPMQAMTPTEMAACSAAAGEKSHTRPTRAATTRIIRRGVSSVIRVSFLQR